MRDRLTSKEWDEIHELVNEYWLEHSKLVNRMIARLSNPEDMQGEFLALANERNSVYGREENVT